MNKYKSAIAMLLTVVMIFLVATSSFAEPLPGYGLFTFGVKDGDSFKSTTDFMYLGQKKTIPIYLKNNIVDTGVDGGEVALGRFSIEQSIPSKTPISEIKFANDNDGTGLTFGTVSNDKAIVYTPTGIGTSTLTASTLLYVHDELLETSEDEEFDTSPLIDEDNDGNPFSFTATTGISVEVKNPIGYECDDYKERKKWYTKITLTDLTGEDSIEMRNMEYYGSSGWRKFGDGTLMSQESVSFSQISTGTKIYIRCDVYNKSVSNTQAIKEDFVFSFFK